MPNSYGLQDCKFINVVPPAAIVNNGSFTTAEIDTAGYNYLTVVWQLGATDIAMTALKVTESDTAGSNHADVTGLVFGTSTLPAEDGGATSALPSATNDNGVFTFYINLEGRKRYIDITATAGNGVSGTYASCLAILSNASGAVNTATLRGNTANLIK